MQEATEPHITPAAAWPPRQAELINLDQHPDSDLLRLCAALQRSRGAIIALEVAVARTPALTDDGRKMKALSL